MPGSGRNAGALQVSLAYFRNHGNNPLYMLCLGAISAGIRIRIKNLQLSSRLT